MKCAPTNQTQIIKNSQDSPRQGNIQWLFGPNTRTELIIMRFSFRKGRYKKIVTASSSKRCCKKNFSLYYGCHYGTIKEYGLADSKDNEDLAVRLEPLRQTWENLCPGFHDWFSCKRKQLFESNVIKSERKQANVQRLFYNNSIESQHFREKKEQHFKKGTVQKVIATLKLLVSRQEDYEIRVIYGSRPYRLSRPF